MPGELPLISDPRGWTVSELQLVCESEVCRAKAKSNLTRDAKNMLSGTKRPAPVNGKHPLEVISRLCTSLVKGSPPGWDLDERRKNILVDAPLINKPEDLVQHVRSSEGSQLTVKHFLASKPDCVRCGIKAKDLQVFEYFAPEGWPRSVTLFGFPYCGGCRMDVIKTALAYMKKEGTPDGTDLPVRLYSVCHLCGKGSKDVERDLQRCSRCTLTYYCSGECQKKDWPRHKPDCRPPAKKSAAGPVEDAAGGP
ncbi:hypothetical protein DFJ74DRAFT_693796 [Hyaloraphidium curvatum]|nr:hypothetical protein DFJ74DRAFT_693796 [Hyaloraphidium curvatum]